MLLSKLPTPQVTTGPVREAARDERASLYVFLFHLPRARKPAGRRRFPFYLLLILNRRWGGPKIKPALCQSCFSVHVVIDDIGGGVACVDWMTCGRRARGSDSRDEVEHPTQLNWQRTAICAA